MKSIFYKLPIYAALLATFGCTDLDVDIVSQYTEIPDSDRAQEAATAEVFFAMREMIGDEYHTLQTLSGDEAIAVSLGTDYYDNAVYMNATLHQVNPDTWLLGTWTNAMSGITLSNTALASLDEDGEVYAQVRAVRAYYYWLLMDGFGDVPIIKGLVDGSEAIDRSPRAEVAEFIESELLEVRDALPTEVSSATYGLPTRYMADALLAKLYLNWAVYTAESVDAYEPSNANIKLNELVAMCDDVIAAGVYNLNDGYREKFLPTNGSHITDFIYTMPFDHTTQQGLNIARMWSHRSMRDEFYGFYVASSVAGVFRMTPSFSDKFSLEGDERNSVILKDSLYIRDVSTSLATDTPWMLDYGDGLGERQVVLENRIEWDDISTLDAGNDVEGRSWGHRSIKIYIDPQTTSSEGRSQSNDIPILRYADVLLMKAEAILRGAAATNGDTPMSLMNQIRSYVNAPLITSDPTLDELLDERAREFLDEAWRRNDLIRYGKYEDSIYYDESNTIPIKTDKRMRIFPVPTSAMETNTNWTQNAGY